MTVEEQELWITQIHVAEIQALLQYDDVIKKNASSIIPTVSDDKDDKTGLSVYSFYKGKQIKRKDGFLGVVSDVLCDYLIVKIVKGTKVGEKIQLSFILKILEFIK